MEEEFTVIFGNLQDGIHRVVTGFETEDEAYEFLEDDGDDGFVIESETVEDDDYEEDYEEDAWCVFFIFYLHTDYIFSIID